MKHITFKYEYDSNGNLIHYINTEGAEILYSYDSDNNLIFKKEINDGIESETSYKYDSFDNLIYIKNPDNIIRRDYNLNNQLIVETMTDLEEKEVLKTLFSYDINGNLINSKNSNGDWISYKYDNKNRQVYLKTSRGSTQETIYNDNFKDVKYSGTNLKTQERFSLPNNILIYKSFILNDVPQIWWTKYIDCDKEGNPIKIIDSNDLEINYSYKRRRDKQTKKLLLSKITTSEGDEIIYTHNQNNNLTKINVSVTNIRKINHTGPKPYIYVYARER